MQAVRAVSRRSASLSPWPSSMVLRAQSMVNLPAMIIGLPKRPATSSYPWIVQGPVQDVVGRDAVSHGDLPSRTYSTAQADRLRVFRCLARQPIALVQRAGQHHVLV